MESNESDLSPGISIRELYENEEKRKTVNDYQKKYNAQPEVIERKERRRIKK